VPHYAVDRIEGQVAVLVGDAATTVNVPESMLPPGAGEGSVLHVPLDGDGNPDWSSAVIDEAERERRLKVTRETLRRLRQSDPGGDLTL